MLCRSTRMKATPLDQGCGSNRAGRANILPCDGMETFMLVCDVFVIALSIKPVR